MKGSFCRITTVTSRGIFFFVYCNIILQTSFALVNFKGESFFLSFVDAPASFALPVNRSGICGALYLAEPLDACSSLRNRRRSQLKSNDQVRFVLIERGACLFEDKVRNAQDAGFQAAIVYDDQFSRRLISMTGKSQGVWVNAVFISKRAGEILKKFAQGENGECCITPLSEGRAWTVLVISIFSLIIMVSVFAMFLFVRIHRIRRQQASQHSPHINRQIVKGLPSVKFGIASRNDNHTPATCAICLEDYKDEESLRVLPCQHEFHTTCVDVWLTKWGTFCPVCKLDLRRVQA